MAETTGSSTGANLTPDLRRRTIARGGKPNVTSDQNHNAAMEVKYKVSIIYCLPNIHCQQVVLKCSSHTFYEV